MSENPTDSSSHPETGPTDFLSPPRKSEGESPTTSRDRYASSPGQHGGQRRGWGKRRDTGRRYGDTGRRYNDTGRREDDAYMREDDAYRRGDDAGRREDDVGSRGDYAGSRGVDDAGRREGDAGRRLWNDATRGLRDDAGRRGDDAGRREDDMGRREDDAGRRRDDTGRRRDDTGRREDDAERREDDTGGRGDDAGRRRDDTGRRGDDTGRRRDDTGRREGDTRRRGDDTRRRGDDAGREDDAGKRRDDAGRRGDGTGRRGDDAERPEDTNAYRSMVGRYKQQRAEAIRLEGEEKRLLVECKRRGDQIAELEERLRRTEELLAARSAELSEAHAFLSTADRLSEMEVVGIVNDLNESVYQVAVHLTDEWERLDQSPSTGRADANLASQPPVSALVQLARNQDPTGLTYLLQSCLCSQAVGLTSSWGRHKELAPFEAVYRRLSASEGQAVSARWRSLTHTHHSQPPPHSASLVEQLASVLYETGSFPSTEDSLEFVQIVALDGIESMIRHALRLERAFMVEVTSSDMSLLFEAADTVFDDTRMKNEFGSDSASTPGGQDDRIAGTIEVGVGKSVFGGAGKDRGKEILLKTKVVLEKDVVGPSGVESGSGGVATK